MIPKNLMRELTLAAALLLPAFFSGSAASAQTPSSAKTAAVVGAYRSNPGHTGVAAEPLTAPLSLLWRHTTQSAKTNPASPVAAEGRVFFASGGGLYAVRAADGARLWQYPADGKSLGLFSATPALDGGALYAADDNGQVTKLEAATGKMLWRAKLDGALRSSPAVADGVVFLGSSNSRCYALSAETGQTLWSAATGGAVLTAPVVTGGLVVFASADNSVYSLGTRTGRKAWAVPFDADPSLVPPVYDGRVLFVTAGDTVYSLDPASGRQRSTLKLPTNVLIPPTVAPNSIYIITQASVLYALSAAGRSQWKAALESAPTAPPLLAGGVLLVTTQTGMLSAYDSAAGRLVWRYVMPATATDSQPKAAAAGVFSAPIAADGTLYLVGDDGTLSAFRADAPDSAPPDVVQLAPASGATVPTDNVTFGALLTDIGSGINPATVSLALDDAVDPLALFHADAGAIYRTSPTPLTEGDHQLTVKAADWRGNAVSKTWHFTVRNSAVNRGNRFNPFDRNYPGGGGRNPNAPPPPPPF